MSGLRPYILDDPESPATLLSSPPLLPSPSSSRRHQAAQQQPQQQHSTLALSSDADASSDVSELEIQRHVLSSSGGEGGGGIGGDYSDYETPLPARWDLAAHWHMGDYYSEGVEGDADDDDDEERDLDTDLSEGPGPGPRAGRRTGGRRRGVQLDMGRVRDILASSPTSTPITFTGLSTRSTAGNSIPTIGSNAGDRGVATIFDNLDTMADFDSHSSSTSEDILSRNHHRAYQSHGSLASERSVRFSRDASAPPSRATAHTPQLTADMNASTPGQEPMSLDLLTPASRSTQPTLHASTADTSNSNSNNSSNNHYGSDDIMQITRPLTENFGDTLGSLSQYQSSTRLGPPTTGQDSSLESFDHPAQPRLYSPTRLTDYTGQGSSRSQFVRYPLPPRGGSGQSRLSTGGGGGGGGGPLQQQQHHHLFALVASTRHGLVSSPRGHLSPYWGTLERSRRQGSHSPRYYSSTSPSSSTSSSRVASPILDSQSAVLKSQEGEPGSMTEQQDEGRHLNQPTLCNTPAAAAGGGIANGQVGALATGGGIGRPPQQGNRLASSTTTLSTFSSNNSITSLPSFASSIFMPSILGTTGEAFSPSGLYRRPKSNHPRRPCCFLQAGQKFSGTQSLKTMASTLSGLRSRQIEEWNVKVSISAVDYVAGTVYGHMEAMDVPMSVSNVVTFWEGEIIDFDNHTLWTKKWSAKERTDLDHWRRLEAFRGMDEKYIIKGAESGRFRGHVTQKYIFMRWKEKHFVNVSEHTSGLTIAGFYYLSMRRSDGYVEGFYHDQASTPFQHLALNPTYETAGFSSPIFEIA